MTVNSIDTFGYRNCWMIFYEQFRLTTSGGYHTLDHISILIGNLIKSVGQVSASCSFIVNTLLSNVNLIKCSHK